MYSAESKIKLRGKTIVNVLLTDFFVYLFLFEKKGLFYCNLVTHIIIQQSDTQTTTYLLLDLVKSNHFSAK